MNELEKEEKILSSEEILTMESFQLKLQLHDKTSQSVKKEIVILELQKQINILKNEILTKSIQELKQNEATEQSKKNQTKLENQEYNKNIAKKYDVNEAWGYNPETGKIITQEKN